MIKCYAGSQGDNRMYTGVHPNAPKAYLNIILFDKNHNFVDAAYKQLVDPNAQQVGTTVKAPHEYLMREVTVTEPGYAYIFFSNENLAPIDVHFDDVTITHTHSNIVAGADYYPFGLVMDGREIDDEPYRYGYQGQFSEKDLTTAMQEFELRMYDPRIGRWLSPDPYGQFASPYLAMGNAPHIGTDPDGGLCCGAEAMEEVYAAAMAEQATLAADMGILGFAMPDLTLGLATPLENASMGTSLNSWNKPQHFEFTTDFTPSSPAPILSDVTPVSTAPLTSSITLPSAATIQQFAGYLGVIPVANTVAGIIEAGAAIAAGDYWGAGLAVLGAIPVVGVGVKWGKLLIQAHHVIPRQLIKEFGLKKISGFVADGLRNIKRIPFPFHGNHPAYTKYVRQQLDKLQQTGSLTLTEIHNLQNHLKQEIRDAWRVHKQGGGNLNDYFR